MDINEKYLLNENKYTKHIPKYLLEYEKFYRLIKVFSNYLLLQSEQLKNITQQLNINVGYGDILEKIGNLLGVSIENKSNKDEEYYEKLRFAILGNGIKKSSVASRYKLEEQLNNILSNTTNYSLADFGCLSTGSNIMEIQLDISGNIKSIDKTLIERYLLPKITGVNRKVIYTKYGKNLFAFDKDIEFNLDSEINYGQLGWDKGEWADVTTV